MKYIYMLNGQTGGTEPQPQPEGGTYDEPFTVEQAQKAWVDGQKLNTYVKGYIVGCVNGSKYTEGALFYGEALDKAASATSTPTNILISDNSQVSSVDQCIPVQLPTGEIRNALNLKDNSNIMGAEILLYGSLETFFKVAGIRSTSYAEVSIFDATGSTVTVGTRPEAAKKRYTKKK